MKEINKMTFDELKEGYKIITGLDNVEDFTEKKLRQYMEDATCENDND